LENSKVKFLGEGGGATQLKRIESPEGFGCEGGGKQPPRAEEINQIDQYA